MQSTIRLYEDDQRFCSGRVVTTNGEPVGDARIEVRIASTQGQERVFTAESDPSGIFSVPVGPGHLATVVCKKSEHTTAAVPFASVVDGYGLQDLLMVVENDRSPIHLKLVNDKNMPLSGMEVGIRAAFGLDRVSVETDSEGQISISPEWIANQRLPMMEVYLEGFAHEIVLTSETVSKPIVLGGLKPTPEEVVQGQSRQLNCYVQYTDHEGAFGTAAFTSQSTDILLSHTVQSDLTLLMIDRAYRFYRGTIDRTGSASYSPVEVDNINGPISLTINSEDVALWTWKTSAVTAEVALDWYADGADWLQRKMMQGIQLDAALFSGQKPAEGTVVGSINTNTYIAIDGHATPRDSRRKVTVKSAYPGVRLASKDAGGLIQVFATDDYGEAIVSASDGPLEVWQLTQFGQTVWPTGKWVRQEANSINLRRPDPANPDTCDVYGFVTAGGEPVGGAQVMIQGASIGTQSINADEDGFFLFAALPRSGFTAAARYPGQQYSLLTVVELQAIHTNSESRGIRTDLVLQGGRIEIGPNSSTGHVIVNSEKSGRMIFTTEYQPGPGIVITNVAAGTYNLECYDEDSQVRLYQVVVNEN